MKRDCFQAIADPTRRKILHLLSGHSLSVNAVAGNFKVSRTAIYKHIKMLTECGLVSVRQRGRQRYCEAEMKQLHEVSDWVEQFRQHWAGKMEAPDTYLESARAITQKQKPERNKTKM